MPVVPDTAAIVPDGVELHAWPPERRGGQHVTRTSTGILALDTKTGIAAVSTDERSMMRNREKALEKLRWLVAINAKERTKANEAPYA